MGTTNRTRAPVPPQLGGAEWKRAFSTFMLEANRGRIAATGEVTLTPGTNTTTVEDERAGIASYIGFMPNTPNAAAEYKHLVILNGAGLFVIEHENNALADRTYRYSIMG